ncbi:MAG: hypothetical protein WCW56_00180 [Candidatus Paceibacterota bacterium]|jgi:hypothetical protein
MEQNFNQAPAPLVSNEASAGSISKKIIITITILLFVLVLILAGIGWYIKRGHNSGLTDIERERMARALGTSTPPTVEERKIIESNMSKSATERLGLKTTTIIKDKK